MLREKSDLFNSGNADEDKVWLLVFNLREILYCVFGIAVDVDWYTFLYIEVENVYVYKSFESCFEILNIYGVCM